MQSTLVQGAHYVALLPTQYRPHRLLLTNVKRDSMKQQWVPFISSRGSLKIENKVENTMDPFHRIPGTFMI